jgi:hypothetical protein
MEWSMARSLMRALTAVAHLVGRSVDITYLARRFGEVHWVLVELQRAVGATAVDEVLVGRGFVDEQGRSSEVAYLRTGGRTDGASVSQTLSVGRDCFVHEAQAGTDASTHFRHTRICGGRTHAAETPPRWGRWLGGWPTGGRNGKRVQGNGSQRESRSRTLAVLLCFTLAT